MTRRHARRTLEVVARVDRRSVVAVRRRLAGEHSVVERDLPVLVLTLRRRRFSDAVRLRRMSVLVSVRVWLKRWKTQRLLLLLLVLLLLLLIFFWMVVQPCIELEGHHVIVVDVGVLLAKADGLIRAAVVGVPA